MNSDFDGFLNNTKLELDNRTDELAVRINSAVSELEDAMIARVKQKIEEKAQQSALYRIQSASSNLSSIEKADALERALSAALGEKKALHTQIGISKQVVAKKLHALRVVSEKLKIHKRILKREQEICKRLEMHSQDLLSKEQVEERMPVPDAIPSVQDANPDTVDHTRHKREIARQEALLQRAICEHTHAENHARIQSKIITCMKETLVALGYAWPITNVQSLQAEHLDQLRSDLLECHIEPLYLSPSHI